MSRSTKPKTQTAPFPLDGLTIQQLIDVRTRADVMLTQRIDQERRELATRLRALDDYKRSIRNVDAKRAERANKGAKSVRRRPKPKYVDPATGNTWAGRGLLPRWLKAEVARGRTVEDFRVLTGDIRNG